MAKSQIIWRTGTMPDGRHVVAFFPLVDTHGIPLEMAVPQLVELGYMPDWLHFYLEAIRHGWAESNTYTRLYNTVSDNFDPEFTAGWARVMGFLRVMLADGEVPRPCLRQETVDRLRAGEITEAEAMAEVLDTRTGEPVHPDVAAHMLMVAP